MNARPLNRTNLAEQAYQAIRDELLSGETVMPGSRISVEDLARRLGVSRSPVWAAIARLEADGMVEVRPRQGVFFVGFDLARLREIFDAREVLEGAAARLAAQRATPADIATLCASITRQRALLADGDRPGYGAEANHFHACLTGLGGNGVISEMVGRLWTRATAMCMSRHRDALADPRIDDHDAIVRAVADGDGPLAETLTRAHLRHLARALGAG